MSDDPSRRSDPSHVTIPPELKPYMGLRKFPDVKRRGEDPELDAAFAALEEARAAPDPAPVADPSRGIGNVKAHASGIELPTAKGPTPAADEPKVELAIVDIPRVLPEGDRSAPTQEMSTRAFRDVVLGRVPESEAPRESPPETEAAPVSRTVGGQTERLQVIHVTEGETPPKGEPRAASPWTKDAAPFVVAEELPSSLRPRDQTAPRDETPARKTPRGRAKAGAAITVAVLVVAAVIAVRAATTTKRMPAHAVEPGPSTVTPDVAAPTLPTLAAVPSSSPSAPPASVSAPAAPPSITPPPAPVNVVPKPSSTRDDPYGDAAVKRPPAATASPHVTAPPAAVPPAPPPTSPRPSSTSPDPAGGDRVKWNP